MLLGLLPDPVESVVDVARLVGLDIVGGVVAGERPHPVEVVVVVVLDQVGRTRGVARSRVAARLARGIFLKERGRLTQARKELTTALDVFGSLSPIDEARACNELAAVERAAGNIDEALELVERGISAAGDSDLGEFARSKREQGLALSQRDARGARKSLEEAIDIFTRAEERVEAALTHAYLGDLLAARNQKQALTEYRKGLALFEVRA
ncbi:MAG: hypothetical protein M3N53_12860 [Actinomycetota bacterium]|nr:hypothetical protein [Actinomycetota bacterium]